MAASDILALHLFLSWGFLILLCMGYGEDVITWIKEAPSDGMAITIFGPMKSVRSMNRIPSRIPISVLNSHHERDKDIEYPTRDKDRKSYNKEVDVRYLNNFQNLKEKFKTSYLYPQTCNQNMCPIIKERMEQHLNQRCCKKPGRDTHCPTGNTTNLRQRNTKEYSSIDSRSMQTNITDVNSTINDDTLRPRNHYHSCTDDSDVNIPLKKTATISIIAPKRNIYKDYVQKEIMEWLQDIPMCLGNKDNKDFDKDGIVRDLAEKVNKLSKKVNSETYAANLKYDIDNSIDKIPMWHPGVKRDQEVYKNKLNESLLRRIKNLNKRLQIKCSSRCSFYSDEFEKIEAQIVGWLNMIKIRLGDDVFNNVDEKEIVKAMAKKIAPLLKKPLNTCHYRIRVKYAIINVLNDFSLGARSFTNNNISLHRFAEDLANRLLGIKAVSKNNNYTLAYSTILQTSDAFIKKKNDFENIIKREINQCLSKTIFDHDDDVKRDIATIIMDYVDSPAEEFDVNEEIVNVLQCTATIPELQASNMAQSIIIAVKCALKQSKHSIDTTTKSVVTNNISVYTSIDSFLNSSFPATSTPKKRRDCSVCKLNPEEIQYAQNVGNLIKAWMETLPEQFNATEERDFKETMINDLAGDITDAAKLEQLAPVDEKEKWLKYIVYKWLQKLDVFDLDEVTPQVEEFLKKVKDIPVPVLTKPQHGNRQAMANLQHMESEQGWQEYFVPKGKDILEDEISIWINKQPPDIFNIDKNTRNTKIHELAGVLEDKLKNKRPSNEIKSDVKQWLGKIVKTTEGANIGELAENIKDRVVRLPQDATLLANRDKKVRAKAEHLEAKTSPCLPVKAKTTEETIKLDKTMQQFINKFIEYNYEIDDPMARGAFSHLLKIKLQRLNPPNKEEVYDNFSKSETNKCFTRDKFINELDYIKDVSDWLKNVPMDASYNTIGNRGRVDFVIDLARNILEVEEQREKEPNAMDYNMYMASIISQFMYRLPILPEYKNEKNFNFMVDQLIGKVIVHKNKNRKDCTDCSDRSGVHSDNLEDFIEEFVRVNGSVIADDGVRLEAWTARLLDEIKKMVRENENPEALSKSRVYNRLTHVPIPTEESLNQFDYELEYIKEITGWMKNLPLSPIADSDEAERVKMICELTEKITERNIKKINNPQDNRADAEFTEYIQKWIADLSLDQSHEIIVEVVIKQLINRIERVKTRDERHSIHLPKRSKTKLTENVNPQCSRRSSEPKTEMKTKNKQMKNPAGAIVDAIEKWSSSLPIQANDEKTKISLQDDISKRLFQKVGELSIDPRTLNDDLLYKDILADEVDAIIEKLPCSPNLQSNKIELRTNLVDSIIEAQKEIKENCAGEFYKQKLEHTMEASIPHPVSGRREFDPGFEIYKSRLADMFILENFDHANDDVKMIYERRIKNEIDKYYINVKNKNVTPLTKDEMYNELYSVLFKVPIPNESSVIGEVEEIKTRCEIDTWYEQLPVREANGLTELLERDKILATLAKRIHEIEKSEPKPADKINKEIMKWVKKFPFLPGKEGKAEKYAKQLQGMLKSSAEKRKYVATERISKGKKVKKGESMDRFKINKNNSQISGPSSDGKMWESRLERVKPKKNAAEIIIEIVEDWCNQLPITDTTPQNKEAAKIIRDNVSTKIIIKISELNMNPNTFNDDFQYNELLDEELDKLLADVPTCCNFEDSKAARKMQLIDAVGSVKPLFKEERAKHHYIQDLDNTVTKVLGKPHDPTVEKEALFKDLKEEIVENFIQLDYDKGDDECRQVYKAKIHNAVGKFLANVTENKDDAPLMRKNQLLCELAKVPIPSNDSLKEEVEEIRMKDQVSKFFDEQSKKVSNTYKDKRQVSQIKSSLAKKLNRIELSGNGDCDNIMKQEVTKSLKKANIEVKPTVVDNFVNKLKGNELSRRAPRKVMRASGINNKVECACAEAIKISKSAIYANEQAAKPSPKYMKPGLVQKLENPCSRNLNSAENISKPAIRKTKENLNCTTSTSEQNLAKSTSQVCCEELERPSEDSFDFKQDTCSSGECISESNSLLECADEYPQRERERNQESERERDELRCFYGGNKGRKTCFMPVRWYCTNPEDFRICRMPVRFFYYGCD